MTTTSMNLDDVDAFLDVSEPITDGLRDQAAGVKSLDDACKASCDGAPSSSVVAEAVLIPATWAVNDADLKLIWLTLNRNDGTMNSSALSSASGVDLPDGSYSPLDDAMHSLNEIRDLLDTARQDDDNNRGVGSVEGNQHWSTNDLKAMAENEDGYYTDEQVAHAQKVLALINASPEARELLGIEESGGGWSFSDIGHLTLDVLGMVPVVGNAADGINAAWYASEGEWLDAALSSMALLPVVGQGVTMSKPAIKAAANGRTFSSLEEALQWAKKWMADRGLWKQGDELADGAGTAASRADGSFPSNGDPMRALQGPGRGTPEWDELVAELDELGIKVEFVPGQIVYDVPTSPGVPGTIKLDPDSSLSALRHEAQHALDDLDNGLPGLGHYMENPGARWQMEADAYDLEIAAARAAGAEDVAQELLQNKALEHQALVDRFGLDPAIFPLD